MKSLKVLLKSRNYCCFTLEIFEFTKITGYFEKSMINVIYKAV